MASRRREAATNEHSAFEEFFATAERKLTIALAARYGPEIGREAAADALAWAWEHWARLRGMENPVGYLFRVGQSSARRRRYRPIRGSGVAPATTEGPGADPGLERALRHLSPRQRTAVVLAVGYGYSQREVADLLGIRASTTQNHIERGLARLRAELDHEEARDG